MIGCGLIAIILSGFAGILIYVYGFTAFLITFLILRRVRQRYSLPSYFGGQGDKHEYVPPSLLFFHPAHPSIPFFLPLFPLSPLRPSPSIEPLNVDFHFSDNLALSSLPPSLPSKLQGGLRGLPRLLLLHALCHLTAPSTYI